jgi:hypothetical protein
VILIPANFPATLLDKTRSWERIRGFVWIPSNNLIFCETNAANIKGVHADIIMKIEKA